MFGNNTFLKMIFLSSLLAALKLLGVLMWIDDQSI